MQQPVHGLTQEQISRAIGLSRILLIVGLVFLHYGNFPGTERSPFLGLDIDSHPLATWINSFALFFFFSAVPLLSMISGWLFFSFKEEQAKEALKKRIRKRFTSLYLPLVVWNAGYLALMYAAFLAMPHAFNFPHGNRLNMDFTNGDWMQYINAVFGITLEPIGFQFWFVRDLFVTALISPIFWQVLKRAPWAGVVVFGAMWLSGWNAFIFLRPDVPFFFYLGALVRRKEISMIVPLRTTLILLALYLVLVGLRAAAPYVVDIPEYGKPYWLDIVTRMMRFVGVISSWGIIYRAAQTRIGARLSGVGGLAFFLHSAHWPLLSIVKIALAKFIPFTTDGGMLMNLLASVTITCAIGLGLGLLLAYKAPRIFSLINGGRLLGQSTTQLAAVEVGPLVPQAA